MTQEDKTDLMIRQKLYGAAVPPPPQVWIEVERALHQRRRRVIGWWLLAIGLTMGGGGLWYFHAPIPAIDAPDQPMAAAAPVVAGDNTQPHPYPTLSATAPVVHHDKENQHSAFNALISDPKTDPQRRPKVLPKHHPVRGTSSELVQLPPSNSAELSHDVAQDNPSPIETVEALENTQPQALAAVNLLPAVPHHHLWPNQKPIPALRPVRILRKKKEQPDRCYHFDTHPNVWMGEIYAGPVTARKRLSNSSNPELNQYVQQRHQTEGQGWGFVAGARAGLLLHRHYLLQSGVEYEQFSEIFRYSDPSSIIVYTKQVYNPQTGQSTLDTISIEFGTETTRIINRFGRIEIPLSAGYEWRHQRYGWRITGGAALNVFFWKRGSILDPQTGKPTWFTPQTGGQEVFRTRTGMSAHGAAQVFWHPDTRTRLFVEPYYRKILHSVTLDTHPLAQQYHIWGIRLGGTLIF